jgi:DNA-binding HxlR family transcriptional regulator
VQVGGDLLLAYRDPGEAAAVVAVPRDQPHLSASNRHSGPELLEATQLGPPYPSQLRDATLCAKITFVLNRDYPGQVCSIAKALEVIGERWSLLIVRDVMNGNRRFDELQKGLGIARNVLSARLQRLVEEDILERRPYQESPERFEYFLTEKGLDLWPALIALLAWGDRHSPEPDGPPMLIVHKECGGPVSDRGVCEACGETLRARDARALPGPGVASPDLSTVGSR